MTAAFPEPVHRQLLPDSLVFLLVLRYLTSEQFSASL